MSKIIDKINKAGLKQIPDVRPGDSVKIHQKISAQGGPASGGKENRGGERIQVFEGIVIVKKHGTGISATITVRKVLQGVGVERIFPLHSPVIEKIEIVKRGKVRRAKLGYLRTAKGKRARLKREEFAQAIAPEPTETPEAIEEKPVETTPAAENK